MSKISKLAKSQILITAALLIVLFITNRHPGWEGGKQLLFASDVESSYEPISQAAPLLPVKNIPKHHAQRMVVPYLIGVLAWSTGLAYQYIYFSILFATILSVLFIFGLLLKELKVPIDNFWFYYSLLIFHPYLFRYYIIVPGMITDLLFVLFSLLVIFMLLKEKPVFVLFFLAGALLFRQTAVMMLPSLLLYVFMNKKSLLRAGLFSFHIILTIFITYIFLNFISQKISHESDNNVAILTSFYSYIVSSRLSIVEIVEFVLRVFIPFISVLACMFSVIFFKKFNLRDKKFIFLFLCGFCIALQPLMTGPLLTGKNAGRLATLGFVPFLLSLSVLSPLPVFSNLCKFLFIFTVGVGSLHHLYTSPGLSSPTQFVLLQFFCFFTIVLVFAFNNFRINAKNDL